MRRGWRAGRVVVGLLGHGAAGAELHGPRRLVEGEHVLVHDELVVAQDKLAQRSSIYCRLIRLGQTIQIIRKYEKIAFIERI